MKVQLNAFTIMSVAKDDFGAQYRMKKFRCEKSGTGRTFPFLSTPNEACSRLSPLRSTVHSHEVKSVSFVGHLPLINLKR